MNKRARSYRLKRYMSIALFALGLLVLLTFGVFAIFGEKIAPYSPTESFEKFLPCSKEHLLGTNNLGYDIFSELIVASRSTIVISLVSAVFCLLIGLFIGVLAGYLNGVAGEALNGFINFFLLIPMLPLAIVIAAYCNGGKLSIILTMSLLCWSKTARAVKAKTAEIKGSEYIRSIRSIGYSAPRILFHHVLPNVMGVATAKFIPSIASCIMVESTLSFLGMGSVNDITWGVMMQNAFSYGGILLGKYNWVLSPGAAIVLLELSLYMVSQYIEFRREIVKESTIKHE